MLAMGPSKPTNTPTPSPIAHGSNGKEGGEVPPTDDMVTQSEITLEEYIAGKRPDVAGLENWADAVRNGRGLITIFGILQPIISGLIADENKIMNADLAPSNSTSNRKHKITVVAYPLGPGLEWWKIRDHGTLPREDDSVDGLGWYIAPEIATGGSSSTNTGNVWSLGCILFELCTGKKAFESQSATTFSITEDSIPFLDGFDKSSQKVVRELIHGMICIDVGKRLSMDEFCNKFGDVVCVINTEFVLPQEQSVSPKQFYFEKENWIGTEIKQVLHSPRIEHLVPTGNTVEDSKNLLKRRKTVVNARTKMLGVEHSATRTSIEIYGWTLFFLGDSKSAVKELTSLLKGAPDSNTTRSIKEGIARGKSKSTKAAQADAMVLFTKIWEDSTDKDLQSYCALQGRAVLLLNNCKYKAAVEDLDTVVSGLRKIFSEPNLYLSEAMTALGSGRGSLKNFAGAKECYEDALRIILNIAGPDHTDVFLNKQHLAVIALETGEFDEAKKLLDQALEGQKRVLGEEDPDTLVTVELLERVQAARVSATATKRGTKRRRAESTS